MSGLIQTDTNKQFLTPLSVNKQNSPKLANETIATTIIAKEKNLEDESPAAQAQKIVEITDDMAILLSKFRNRRDYEKKWGSFPENFDQILDEDVKVKLHQLIQHVNHSQRIDVESLWRYACSLFHDASDLYIVLQLILNRLHEEKEVKKKVFEELVEYCKEKVDKKILNAGINIALKAHLYGKKLTLDPKKLRTSYRAFLTSDDSELTLYQEWLEDYGFMYRLELIDFMRDALLIDIDSQDPSCSQAEFGDLLKKIVQLKVIRAVDMQFTQSFLEREGKTLLSIDDISNALKFLLFTFQEPKKLKKYFYKFIAKSLLVLKQHNEMAPLLRRFQKFLQHVPAEIFNQPTDKHLLQENVLFFISELLKDEEKVTAVVKKHALIKVRLPV